MGRSYREVWYTQGLRFECTQCGECCSGESGTVEFTFEEAHGMARTLNLSYQAFMERYTIRHGATWILTEVDSPDRQGYDCALLERDDATGLTRCLVHKERPAQCRTWPFWPETLKSPRTWRQAGRDCEGIERGAIVSFQEICRNRDLTPEPGAPYLEPPEARDP
jgi:Fe-S-cluster containining protein